MAHFSVGLITQNGQLLRSPSALANGLLSIVSDGTTSIVSDLEVDSLIVLNNAELYAVSCNTLVVSNNSSFEGAAIFNDEVAVGNDLIVSGGVYSPIIDSTSNSDLAVGNSNSTQRVLLGNVNHGVYSAFKSAATDPSTSDISSGFSAIWKNTTTGQIQAWANDGGVMKNYGANFVNLDGGAPSDLPVVGVAFDGGEI